MRFPFVFDGQKKIPACLYDNANQWISQKLLILVGFCLILGEIDRAGASAWQLFIRRLS